MRVAASSQEYADTTGCNHGDKDCDRHSYAHRHSHANSHRHSHCLGHANGHAIHDARDYLRDGHDNADLDGDKGGNGNGGAASIIKRYTGGDCDAHSLAHQHSYGHVDKHSYANQHGYADKHTIRDTHRRFGAHADRNRDADEHTDADEHDCLRYGDSDGSRRPDRYNRSVADQHGNPYPRSRVGHRDDPNPVACLHRHAGILPHRDGNLDQSGSSLSSDAS